MLTEITEKVKTTGKAAIYAKYGIEYKDGKILSFLVWLD